MCQAYKSLNDLGKIIPWLRDWLICCILLPHPFKQVTETSIQNGQRSDYLADLFSSYGTFLPWKTPPAFLIIDERNIWISVSSLSGCSFWMSVRKTGMLVYIWVLLYGNVLADVWDWFSPTSHQWVILAAAETNQWVSSVGILLHRCAEVLPTKSSKVIQFIIVKWHSASLLDTLWNCWALFCFLISIAQLDMVSSAF